MQDNTGLEELSQAQRERLAHIDFTLLFKGEAGRSYLTERFSVAPSVATQDFARYKELAPNNVMYDEKRRVHLKTSAFQPLFDYDVVRTLATISQGFGDGFLGKVRPPMACEAPFHLNKPKLEVVAAISEAIHKRAVINIEYTSLSSGHGSRQIVPHTLIDNGLRWHVRAFDRKHREFRDFVLTRISEVELLEDEVNDEVETLQWDKQWNRIVELELIPHPKLAHPEAVSMDYAMENNRLRVEIRAAFAGYLLRLWNIDCSKNSKSNGREFQLALKNPEALYGVDNTALAPGYSES
ncbi:WYL domain-containing protein [Providencia sp. wls1922]|nr:WYL domain-containing protein [Providencia sp. wls1922]